MNSARSCCSRIDKPGEGRSAPPRAKVLSRPVKFEGVVLRRLSDSSGADELNDLLREPDGMHQLVQVPGIVARFYRELPAVLLDSFGGSQEADNGLFPLCSPVQGAFGRLTAGIDAQGLVLTQQRAAGAYDDPSKRQDGRAHRCPAHTDDDAASNVGNASPRHVG